MSSQIQEIKQATDIVQFIGERISLTRAGKNFKALCPFHSEKTPSFFVTPELQRYKCFGCGKSGDVLTFVQEYDSIPFPDALLMLADRAGIILEQKSFSKEDERRRRLTEVLHLASEYYHYVLTDHPLGEKARAYLEKRGIHQEAIRTFKLGYALNSWDALSQYLVGKKHYTEKELEDAGLILQSSSQRYYDRFRNRIIFPLTQAHGKVVGFSARVLEKDVKEAKYINSPETMLYHKSELLFGYAVLKNFIRKEEEVFVVEGEFDVISSYQAGVKPVVAIKGSAFTPMQFKLLSRIVKRVILALDADEAGIAATKRAIATAKTFDISIRVLPISGGKDPDEIASENPKLWRELVKTHVSAYEFLIDSALRKHNKETGEGKRHITNEAVIILSEIEHVVEQAHYLQYLSSQLAIKQDLLEQELEKYQRKQRVLGGSVSKIEKKDVFVEQKRGKREQLERYLLSLLLQADTDTILQHSSDMLIDNISVLIIRKIMEALQEYVASHEYNISSFSAQLSEEYKQTLSELYLSNGSAAKWSEKEWASAVARYKELLKKDTMQKLAGKISVLENRQERSAEEERVLSDLENEFVKVSSEK